MEYFKINKDIKQHWLWNDSDRLKWWIDLVFEASEKSSITYVNFTEVKIRKGQVIASLRSLGDKWRVSKDTVRRFLSMLEKSNMIELEDLKFSMKITINDSFIESEQSTSENKAKKEDKESVKESFELFFNEYHKASGLKKTDKAAAFKKWKSLTKKERDKATLMIKPYIRSIEDLKFCKKARTYLNDRNFDDEFKGVNVEQLAATSNNTETNTKRGRLLQ